MPFAPIREAPRPAGFSTDDDLADHAVLGVGLAVLVADAALEVGEAAGCDGHEPPFGAVAGIDLDLADGALELGERLALAGDRRDDLDLALNTRCESSCEVK